MGFSDHSEGINAALGAVALGACVVEKHFTLDKNMPGPDHQFSSDPSELKRLVTGIRRMEEALGNSKILPAAGEIEMRKIARRSIVAAKNLPAGHVITQDDLAFQRPGTGLMPYELTSFLGQRIRKPLEKKMQIT